MRPIATRSRFVPLLAAIVFLAEILLFPAIAVGQVANPPVIDTPGYSTSLSTDGSFHLYPTIVGTGPISYQWYTIRRGLGRSEGGTIRGRSEGVKLLLLQSVGQTNLYAPAAHAAPALRQAPICHVVCAFPRFLNVAQSTR